MYFALSPKYSLFACRLNEWSSAFPQLSSSWAVDCWHLRCRGPGNHLRRHAAAHCRVRRPHQGCRAFAFKRGHGGCHEQQRHGASKREAGPEIPSLAWGTSEGFFSGIEIRQKNTKNVCIFSKCLAKL